MDKQLENINKRLDSLRAFLEKHMVTKQELEDLRAELPMRADFVQLQTSVDSFAKRYKRTDEELQVVGERTSRMEAWIQKAASKVGVEYKP
jgi:predicted  nucleic acid-binding Zn-ribbon protein